MTRFSLLALLILECAAYAEITKTKLFGPETPTGLYKHPACIEQLDNGDLVLAFYSGQGEYARDTAVYFSRKPAGSTEWSKPIVVARDPFRSTGNAVLWQAPDGTLWLLYIVRFGKTWTDSRTAAKLSTDRGQTWSDSGLIALEPGVMVRNKPVVLASGEYLFPLYKETGNDTEFIPPDTRSVFLKYLPKSKEWKEAGTIRSTKGNLQPAVVEITPGRLVAYCRRGGGYGPTKDGWLVRAESSDGGQTWTEGVDSAFKNPHSAIELIKLRNGHLMMIFNDSMSERTPLTVAISEDNDRNWPRRRNLAGGTSSYAYPSAAEGKDGLIHLVYTTDERRTLEYMTFTEADIR